MYVTSKWSGSTWQFQSEWDKEKIPCKIFFTHLPDGCRGFGELSNVECVCSWSINKHSLVVSLTAALNVSLSEAFNNFSADSAKRKINDINVFIKILVFVFFLNFRCLLKLVHSFEKYGNEYHLRLHFDGKKPITDRSTFQELIV